MGSGNKKHSLQISLFYMAIIPLMLCGICISIISYSRFKRIVYEEINTGLENISYMVANTYDMTYPGNYEIVAKDNLVALRKGGYYLKNEYLDSVKIDTGLEITIFYQDIRMLTTITDSDGNRITGTRMNSNIKKDVLGNGKVSFYSNVKINDMSFFAIYLPIYNSDNESPVGAVCVLKSAVKVNKLIAKSVLPIFAIIVLGVAASVFFIIRYFKSISVSFSTINRFLIDVGNGNLKTEMSTQVLARNDEISDVAKASIGMQKSIRELVEKDALTGIYNRRYANKRLLEVARKNTEDNTPFTICISDIDFFKKVNDTYGHDAGDRVLISVALILKKFMNRRGFVARWGGEEFLLVFDSANITEVDKMLNELLDEIRMVEVMHGDQIIKLTMSAGACEVTGHDVEDAIKKADAKLYYAKEHGRNQAVTKDI